MRTPKPPDYDFHGILYTDIPRANPAYYVEVDCRDALEIRHSWKVYGSPEQIEKKAYQLREWLKRLAFEGVIEPEWGVSAIREEWH